MNKKLQSSAAVVLCMAAGVLGAVNLGGMIFIPQYVTDAVASSSRPDKDRDRDVNRKPAAVISFAGIKPGQKMAELPLPPCFSEQWQYQAPCLY